MLAQVERLAEAGGLGLQQVSLTGHDNTTDIQVFDAIDLGQARTLLSFDGKAAQARVEALPWVARASIERVLPDRLEVRITERTAFAVWRLGDRAFLIDKTGRVLAPVKAQSVAALPQVAGEGAAAEAAALVDTACGLSATRAPGRACRAGRRAALDAAAGGRHRGASARRRRGGSAALARPRWRLPGCSASARSTSGFPGASWCASGTVGSGEDAPRAGDLALPAGRG